MNALHPPACRELDQAFNDFSDDPNSWVAIITGAGNRAFSAGNDLKWQAQHGGEAWWKEINSLQGGFGGITRRFDCFKPIIAAVNGLALGGGFEIALACDILIAAEHATFGLPEPKVGMMAEAGGIYRLPRQAPYHMIMGLILTARQMSAQEAHQMGFVNEVVPLEELLPVAKRWAAQILSCAPLAVRASKEAAQKGLDLPLKEAIGKIFPGIMAMRKSDDYIEGPQAFAEKRNPKWKGR